MLNAEQVQRIIGYEFKNKEYLATAFTHSSFANENGCKSGERLEFLGDSVLNFLVSVELFANKELNEGELTVLRSRKVSKKPLADAVESLGLMEFLRLGEGVSKSDNLSQKFKSDIFESVLGAMYLDGGLAPCEKFIKNTLKFTDRDTDFKTALQEYAQANKLAWKYESEQKGELFVCTLTVKGQTFDGEGAKKKDAEQSAAQKACRFFGAVKE